MKVPTSPVPSRSATEAPAGIGIPAQTGPANAPRVAVDPGRWPDVAALPRASRARTALAERLVRRALARLPLRVRIAGRDSIGLGGPLMEIREPDAF